MPDHRAEHTASGAGATAAAEPAEPWDVTELDESGRSPAVSLAEFLLLAAALVIGEVALVSLVTAHLHHFSAATVGVGSVILIGLSALLLLRLDHPRLTLDLPGLVPVLVGLAFAAVMLLPGFHYGTGDRDPGAYVEIASAIQAHHSVEFADPLVQAGLPGGAGPGAQWPALWDKPGEKGTIFPQFYHLWPALLATAKTAGGWTGLYSTGPLLGIIAVGLAVAIARRLAGWPAAWAVAALLTTNMLQVWQAKYPTAEIFGQMLFVAGMLGVVLAIRTGWRSAAGIAGLMLGLGYLERADGIVLILLAWLALAVLLAARRFDARAIWFTVGLVALLPYGFYQAYGLAEKYTSANSVPTLPKVLAGMVLLAVIGAALGWQRRLMAATVSRFSAGRSRFVLAASFILVCGLLALVGGLRPRLFGPDYYQSGNGGGRLRSYDEISLIRLSWFFSLPGMFLMFAGIVFVAVRPWRLDRWLFALPAVGLLTLYCYHVRNSAYLMWSTRRFVTTVVPGMVVLMGCGIALGVWLLRRYLPRVVALVLAAAFVVGLAVFNLSESWPLRSHNENGGAVEVERQLADLSGNQKGVYLWFRSAYCCNAPYQLFGGPMLTMMNQDSALLPSNPGLEASAVKQYVQYFAKSGRPVFYVADGKGLPPTIEGVTSTRLTEIAGALPHWAETYTSRPKTTVPYNFDVTVFRMSLAGS